MKGKITISKPTRGDGVENVVISVKDNSSRNRFVDVSVDLKTFAKVLMGQSEMDCDFELRKPEIVGKTRELSHIEFEMPEGVYFDKEIAKQTENKVMPEGWQLWDSFSSQGSFFTRNGVKMARGSIIRYVEE